MDIMLTGIFILAYLAIAFEHPLRVNKTASALLGGVLCWAVYAMLSHDPALVSQQLSHHLSSIAEILFFLMGAMTIVELMDAHHSFSIITDRIKTRNLNKLLWIISLLSFFLSAVLDNLTTAIVMVSLLRKLIKNEEQRRIFAAMVIIASNAGGAWSPIGDVTTTMLWIGGQISPANIMKTLLLPSLVCMLLPLVLLSWRFRKEKFQPVPASREEEEEHKKEILGSRVMFFLGLTVLLFVPVFKTITHLPPYLGVLLGLSVVWIVSEIIHKDRDEEDRKPFTAVYALSKIDTASVLFFLGILVAISALESTHILATLSVWMDTNIANADLIVTGIGLLSAVVDNVPLLAAAMGMYDLATVAVNPEVYQYAMAHPNLLHDGMIEMSGHKYYLQDARIWEFLAYCTGTGGSVLIIGSAAGVAVMGMEKLDFIWYLKKISWLALLGYLAGVLAYMFVYPFFAVYS